MTAPRQVSPEALDGLPADAPEARRSRADLRRLHRWMGTRHTLLWAWQRLLPAGRHGQTLRVLELGAGDGSLLLALAARLAPAGPAVQLTLLDRQALLSPGTAAAYARHGWQASALVQDALDWAAPARPGVDPPAGPRWDLVVSSLFLHHFDGAALGSLLAAVARCSDRLIAIEPRRARLALWASHAVGLIGANAVTRGDAVLSVRAGFTGQELQAAWPAQAPAWQLHEAPAGCFSHCLLGQVARTSGAAS